MRTALGALLLVAGGAPAPAREAARAQVALLGDWAMAHCLTTGFGLASAAGKDAADSAAALLEKGDYGIDTYEAIGRLVERRLARPDRDSGRTGYTTLHCLDLMRDPELRALVTRAKPTPVRP